MVGEHGNQNELKMTNLFLIFIGGGLGSLLRFGIGLWLIPYSERFPFGTLAANVLASLTAGFILSWAASHHDQGSLRSFALIGFCGGFSTFSTFSLECYTMIQDGHLVTAILYALGSVLACVLGVVMGFWLSKL